MSKVLKILARADGEATEHDLRYVVYFNPDQHSPLGDYDGGTLITTSSRRQAKQFPTLIEALEYWKQPVTCACHRFRADGKANRPLTAFTVTVEEG